uniref:Uncharacterized protein n=1 Tax=Panagrolaimus sp. JU765 TaxID=591449 RepID=A0AC34QSS1_9BILA
MRYEEFDYDPRTADECKEKSRVAQETEKPLEVFKSISVLQDYVEFPDCYMTDVMHSFYEGPVQLDLKMIFENKKLFSYMNSNILGFNSCLPADLSGRSLRFIDDLNNYKAREWKVMLLYVIVIFFNQAIDCPVIVGPDPRILKRQMLNILQLVGAIIGLSLDSVTKETMKHSEKLMRKWFADRDDLFKTIAGQKNPYTPKVHDLTHLIKQTENHGPTQSTSCFAGENIMGRSDDLVTAKDPDVVLKQIFRRSRECALVKQWVCQKKEDPILGDFINSIHKSDDFEGKATKIPATAMIAEQLNKKFGLTSAKINRYKFKGSPFPGKLNNNAVCFYEKSDETGLQPARIEYIVQYNDKLYCQVRNYETIPIWNKFFEKDELLSNPLSFPDYGIVVSQSSTPVIIEADRIKRKGFLVLSAKQYIIPLLHAFEHD